MPGETARDGRYFQGFERTDRRAGVRNEHLVLPSVICSGMVSESIADAVPDATCLPHDHGCGQIGSDKDQTRRTLLNVSENPNVAGVTIVGLGCETLDSEALAGDLDVPVSQTAIQTAGGTDAAIAAGTAATEELSDAVRSSRRVPVDVSELTVGIAISDLADSTVETVLPTVERLGRMVTDAGGRVVVAGLEALVPHADRVADITANDVTADRLRERLDHRGETVPPTRIRREAENHSIERIADLWADEPLGDVVAYGDTPVYDSHVSVVDAGAQFEESATALAAAGAQVIVHVTAAGIPTGHPVVPVLKVTGEEETAAVLGCDIDVNATAADQRDLYERVLETANGAETTAEKHGLEPFAISRTGPSL